MNYLVQLTNTTLTLDISKGPNYELISIQNHTVFTSYGDNAATNTFTTIGGFQLALQNLYGSNASYVFGGGIGFVLSETGSMASEYSIVNETSFTTARSTCGGTWRDPTQDILQHINELSFRTAISAYTLFWNGESIFPVVNASVVPQNISMIQSRQELVYNSRYGFLAGALVIMVLSSGAVLLTFWGFWEIGRSVSLSPVHTAEVVR